MTNDRIPVKIATAPMWFGCMHIVILLIAAPIALVFMFAGALSRHTHGIKRELRRFVTGV